MNGNMEAICSMAGALLGALAEHREDPARADGAVQAFMQRLGGPAQCAAVMAAGVLTVRGLEPPAVVGAPAIQPGACGLAVCCCACACACACGLWPVA